MDCALGCWQFGPSFGFWDGQDAAQSRAVLRLGLKSGIRHFDTAPSYGNGLSEQLLGSVLKSRDRCGVFIATKLMPGPSDPSASLRRSLDRLKTPYIDLVYLHYPGSRADRLRSLQALAGLKERGLVRGIGLSNFSLRQIEEACSLFPIDWIQRPVSLLWTRELDAQLAFCREKGIKVAGYSPLGLGLLLGKSAQDSRRNLYCFRPESAEVFKALTETITESSDPVSTCYSWVKAKNPDIVILGARTEQQLMDDLFRMKSAPVGGPLFSQLDELADLLQATAPPEEENLFFHRGSL